MFNERKVTAIILAGGLSSRYRNSRHPGYIGYGDATSGLSKQFALLAGKPLINYSVDTFAASVMVDSLILVVPAAEREIFENDIYPSISVTAKNKLYSIVVGGPSRLSSAANAIKVIAEDDCLVAIHDAARPLISQALIEESIRAADANDGAALAMPITDTLGFVPAAEATIAPMCSNIRYLNKSLPRSAYYAMQTPQVFTVKLLREAFAWAIKQTEQTEQTRESSNDNFTDESSIVLAHNPQLKIAIVAGSSENMKLTHPVDKDILEAILKSSNINDSSD